MSEHESKQIKREIHRDEGERERESKKKRVRDRHRKGNRKKSWRNSTAGELRSPALPPGPFFVCGSRREPTRCYGDGE